MYDVFLQLPILKMVASHNFHPDSQQKNPQQFLGHDGQVQFLVGVPVVHPKVPGPALANAVLFGLPFCLGLNFC